MHQENDTPSNPCRHIEDPEEIDHSQKLIANTRKEISPKSSMYGVFTLYKFLSFQIIGPSRNWDLVLFKGLLGDAQFQ